MEDVREIASALPETTETVSGHTGGASWRTNSGAFVWERGPRKADIAALAALGRTWPDGLVVGLRTDGLETKEEMLAALPDVVFTTPHFDGYPALLVRLDVVERDLLAELIADAWLVKAPRRLAKQWLAEHDGRPVDGWPASEPSASGLDAQHGR